MKLSRRLVYKAILLGFVLSCFLMRPSALGQEYSVTAMILSSLLLFAYLVIAKSNLGSRGSLIYGHMQHLFFFLGMYLAYEIVISILFKKSDLVLAAKEVSTAVLFTLSYAPFLLGKENNRVFFSIFTTLISALGLSAALTYLLSVFFGFDFLYLFSISIKGYGSSNEQSVSPGAIYFPLTMLYSQFTSGEVQLLRVSGFFREAGIYQSICCYCLAHAIFTRRSTLIVFGLLAGIITAFSTAGILVVVATLGLIFLYFSQQAKTNIIYFFLFAAIAYPAAVYTPYIGLHSKNSTHSASISDRSSAVSEGIKEFGANPLGNGLFSSKKEHSGIILIASIGAIGLIGFVLQILILSGWRFDFSSPSQKKMITCFPLLLTALFSQPIAAAPLMYILTMIDYD